MPGTKIINVLKDDTFKDILDLFRTTDAEDVVFVLPKRSAVFRREDHFAAFASESRRTGKRVSILCKSDTVNTWARKYAFTVIAKSRSASTATLATTPLNDEDEETRNPNIDAYDPDVVVPSDERMGVLDTNEDEASSGLHAVDDDAEPSPEDEDDEEGKPTPSSPIDPEAGDDDFEQTLRQYGPNDMEFYDDEGNLIGAQPRRVTASLATSRNLDGIRTRGGRSVGVKGSSGRTTKVGVRAIESPAENPESLDYIDAVWRDTVTQSTDESDTDGRWKGLFGRAAKAPGRTKRRLGHGTRKAVTIAVVAMAIGGAVFLFFGLGKAHVQVVPVSRDLEFEVQVQASDAFADVDPLFNKIPGQLFEIERTVERTFNATGSQEVAAKAKGTLTVENRFSSAPQTLIATTRFEDPEGRVFRTLRTITVPGQSADGTPGTVTVDVIADKPGPEYNIEPTTFVIPAFREQGDTGRFNGFAATSEVAFQGGALGLSNIVTQQDVDQALEKVTEELRTEVRQAFDSQTADLLLINAADVEVSEPQVSADVDQAVDTFTVTATGRLTTVGFREGDLYVLLNENAVRNWQVTVRPEFMDLQFDDISFVSDRGILAFTVAARGKGFVRLDEAALVRDIRGLGREAVRNYFRAADGVRSSTVLLSPLWVRSVPEAVEDIELEVLYEVTEQ